MEPLKLLVVAEQMQLARNKNADYGQLDALTTILEQLLEQLQELIVQYVQMVTTACQEHKRRYVQEVSTEFLEQHKK